MPFPAQGDGETMWSAGPASFPRLPFQEVEVEARPPRRGVRWKEEEAAPPPPPVTTTTLSSPWRSQRESRGGYSTAAMRQARAEEKACNRGGHTLGWPAECHYRFVRAARRAAQRVWREMLVERRYAEKMQKRRDNDDEVEKEEEGEAMEAEPSSFLVCCLPLDRLAEAVFEGFIGGDPWLSPAQRRVAAEPWEDTFPSSSSSLPRPLFGKLESHLTFSEVREHLVAYRQYMRLQQQQAVAESTYAAVSESLRSQSLVAIQKEENAVMQQLVEEERKKVHQRAAYFEAQRQKIALWKEAQKTVPPPPQKTKKRPPHTQKIDHPPIPSTAHHDGVGMAGGEEEEEEEEGGKKKVRGGRTTTGGTLPPSSSPASTTTAMPAGPPAAVAGESAKGGGGGGASPEPFLRHGPKEAIDAGRERFWRVQQAKQKEAGQTKCAVFDRAWEKWRREECRHATEHPMATRDEKPNDLERRQRRGGENETCRPKKIDRRERGRGERSPVTVTTTTAAAGGGESFSSSAFPRFALPTSSSLHRWVLTEYPDMAEETVELLTSRQ